MLVVSTVQSKTPMPKWLPYSGGSDFVARLSAITEYRVSVRKGEVTPEQAFEIGKATARQMWGDTTKLGKLLINSGYRPTDVGR